MRALFTSINSCTVIGPSDRSDDSELCSGTGSIRSESFDLKTEKAYVIYKDQIGSRFNKNSPWSFHHCSCPHKLPLVLDLHLMPRCHNPAGQCPGCHCYVDCLFPEGSAQHSLKAEHQIYTESEKPCWQYATVNNKYLWTIFSYRRLHKHSSLRIQKEISVVFYDLQNEGFNLYLFWELYCRGNVNRNQCALAMKSSGECKSYKMYLLYLSDFHRSYPTADVWHQLEYR